ncbi:MAG: peptidoglycan DD-metalloendopeptidase family protein [bacterium]|nr:peptidoglycan DD-metalloendopeptidase family protein [bacterium]
MQIKAKIGSGFLVLVILVLNQGQTARAGILDDLKAKIDDRQGIIQKLEQEIKQYQGALQKTQVEKNTLNTELKKIDLTDKHLTTELKVTETKISSTNLTINKLSYEIKTKEEEIGQHQLALAETLRQLADQDQIGLMEALLTYTDTAEMWGDLAILDQFQNSVNKRIVSLDSARRDLNTKKGATETEQKRLDDLKGQLADEKKLVVQNKNEKNKLLTETKSKESAYQSLLADRIKKKEAVENEIADLESQIKVVVDPSSLPSTGKGVLKWPLAKIIITQYFGNTAFASANPQVYNGKGHNGVDFGTPVGTPVMAARGGTILGSGNTDLTCPGASYGQWVLIKHDNGLATLYAHLSVIKAVTGASVSTGELVGYSGNTGYSTGPHLHFTLFASEAVAIGTLKSRVKGCGTYTLPLSSQSGYLNPLSYL